MTFVGKKLLGGVDFRQRWTARLFFYRGSIHTMTLCGQGLPAKRVWGFGEVSRALVVLGRWTQRFHVTERRKRKANEDFHGSRRPGRVVVIRKIQKIRMILMKEAEFSKCCMDGCLNCSSNDCIAPDFRLEWTGVDWTGCVKIA